MPDRHARLRWALTALLSLAGLVVLACWGLYAAGAHPLPDALPPSAWRADPMLRRQYLAANGIAPANVPRLNPVSVWYYIVRDAARTSRNRGHALQLPTQAARVVSARWTSARQGTSTLQRHLMEIALTTRLSREWTPEQMVDAILAESHYARGVRGFEAASQFYFQLPAKDLRPQETLALVALLRSPSWYDPVCNRERFERRYAVLAAKIGGTGPAWTSAVALARLRAGDCARA